MDGGVRAVHRNGTKPRDDVCDPTILRRPGRDPDRGGDRNGAVDGDAGVVAVV